MFNKKILIFVFLNIFLIQKIFGFFVIYEVFPNTIDDKILEYISIKYNGEGQKSLSGYTLEDSTKVYRFNDDLFQENEIKKYFRTETSIILNNTGKELYLKDIDGNIIDTFIYGNTVKGIIYRKNDDGNLVEIEESSNQDSPHPSPLPEGEGIEEEIIEEAETISHEFEEISPEPEEISPESEETSPQPSPQGEGEEGLNINNEVEEEEIVNISVKNIFQSPTYLQEKDFDFGSGQAVYNCDRTRDDCRVNLDFRPTFVGDLKENQFNCLVDFGFGFVTGEENKCNPNTVVVPLGAYTFDIKITHKTNWNISGNIKMRVINDGKLITPKAETQIVYQSVGSNNSSSNTSNIQTNNSVKNIDFPTPIIKVQSGLDKNNICNKKECSVNLIYELVEKNVDCSWDFGDGVYRVGDENKCNPIAAKYSSGTHIIKLEVCEKGNDTNCKTSELKFENLYKKQEVKSVITLQGRLTKNKTLDGENKIICTDSKSCSINLTGGKSSGEKISYFWDFGNGEYFEGKNPSSKIFEEGSYEVRLEVTDLDGDFSESFFYIDVIDKIQNIIEIENLSDNFLSNFSDDDNNKIENKVSTNLKIELQGKIGQNKVLEGNNLICIKTCSVNFTGNNSTGNIVSYFWDFGNGEVFSGSNPPHISYKNFGKYSVLLSVEDIYGEVTEKEFFIDFVEKLEIKNDKNLKLIEKDSEQEIYEIISDLEENGVLENSISIESDDSFNLHVYIIILTICLFLGFGFILLKKYDLIK